MHGHSFDPRGLFGSEHRSPRSAIVEAFLSVKCAPLHIARRCRPALQKRSQLQRSVKQKGQ